MKKKLILRQAVPTLGEIGDVVEVAPGYARNYLLPRGLAMPFSEEGMRAIEKASREAAIARDVERANWESLANRLAEVSLTFEERVSADGHLYGSVSAHQIHDALAAQGFDLEERHIRLEEPIRFTGEYTVVLHLHADVNAQIKVWVVAAQEEEEAPAP